MTVPWEKWLPGSRQIILKSDLLALWYAISEQPTVRMQPPLIWVDVATVRVDATEDCPAEMAMTGMPNILNPTCQVGGGLTDNIIRSITTPVSCILSAGGLYGTTQTEKASQWYAVFAMAADVDTDFELKAIPFMRVKSQTGQAIQCGTLVTPATGINYAFTDNDLVGGKIYMLSSANNRGLMRTIGANDVDTDTRITYNGDALTVTAGDWFIVLPPNINFRMVGTFLNKANGDIRKFRRLGHKVQILESVTCGYGSGVVEDINVACPLAVAANTTVLPHFDVTTESVRLGHPDTAAGFFQGCSQAFTNSGQNLNAEDRYVSMDFNLEFCRYRAYTSHAIALNYYAYPPGAGF